MITFSITGELERAKNDLEEVIEKLKIQHIDETATLKEEHSKELGGIEKRLQKEADEKLQIGKIGLMK